MKHHIYALQSFHENNNYALYLCIQVLAGHYCKPHRRSHELFRITFIQGRKFDVYFYFISQWLSIARKGYQFFLLSMKVAEFTRYYSEELMLIWQMRNEWAILAPRTSPKTLYLHVGPSTKIKMLIGLNTSDLFLGYYQFVIVKYF